jgi:hypothetical protein
VKIPWTEVSAGVNPATVSVRPNGARVVVSDECIILRLLKASQENPDFREAPGENYVEFRNC